ATATLGVDLCYLGRADDGLARLDAARRSWPEHGGGARELASVDGFGGLSDTLTMLGRLHDAAPGAPGGLETAGRGGVEGSIGIVLAANAVEALHGVGEWQRAREVAHRALRRVRAYQRHPILLCVAALELGAGELQQAREHLEEAAGWRGQRDASRHA